MNVMICEEDTRNREQFETLLSDIARRNALSLVLSRTNTADELLFRFEDARADYMQTDLICMGIQMLGTDGLRAAKQLRGMGYNGDFVFCAGDASYAIDGYDVRAFHYIVKFKTPVTKIEEIIVNANARAERRKEEALILSCAGETRRIYIRDIHYFEVRNRVVTVFYGDESFEFYTSLRRIDEALFGKGFVRVHSSFLVSKNYISSVRSKEVRLYNGRLVPIGRAYAQQVKDSFAEPAL